MLCCEEEIKVRVGITYGDFGTGAGTNHQLQLQCAGFLPWVSGQFLV